MAAKQKRKLQDLSVDEFMLSGLDSGSDTTDMCFLWVSFSDRDAGKLGNATEHKKQLSRLQDKDPEFYKFLQANDQKLLNFDDTDSSDDEEERKYHRLPAALEEDEEGLKASKKSKKAVEVTKVTDKMIKDWKTLMKKDPNPHLFREVTQAFKAAVSTTKGEGGIQCRYKVDDSSVFNALVLFCIRDIYGALQRMLNLKPEKDQKKLVLPSSSPRWQKNQIDIKMYLSGVIQLLSCLTESTVISAVLQHTNQLVPYFLCLPKQCRHLVKQLMKQWSTGEETSRVLSFLALNKMCRHKQETYLNPILKQMYISYVQNCKFTSPNALPMINFMQRTLTEMYALDTQASYQHAFIYIRQLAIHLRNAMTMKKKETYQSVYNWQYIHCLFLWCRVLSTLHPSDVLQPLIYPLCQVILGTIKLVPSSRYYPLRMHCCRALTLLSSSTNTFVPVLPFLLEMLQQVDFNKKPGRMSKKPINFAVTLKLSNVNLTEKAYKDGLIDQLYDLILEYFHTQSSSIGYPELALPTVIQKYTDAVLCCACKGGLDAAWEKQIQEEGTPLSRYYSQWKKLREKEIQLEISGKERMEDLDLPEIKRRKVQEKKVEDKKEFKDLFEYESGSDEDDGKLKIKGKTGRRGYDDDYDEDMSDMSNDEEVMGGDSDDDDVDEEAPQPLSSSALIKLAEGDEDLVEDLELSDDD
uniref:NOC2-like nucleolar associated transcriptional repressor n=1 Tax=Gasterosteus aculeatus aculeatus TaxID=481459 RepID=A0AAQ4S0L0_GASAC